MNWSVEIYWLLEKKNPFICTHIDIYLSIQLYFYPVEWEKKNFFLPQRAGNTFESLEVKWRRSLMRSLQFLIYFPTAFFKYSLHVTIKSRSLLLFVRETRLPKKTSLSIYPYSLLLYIYTYMKIKSQKPVIDKLLTNFYPQEKKKYIFTTLILYIK